MVERLKGLGYAARAGELKLKLAREFGFCYGVDRAVEYAYETREQFPDRRIFLSGEIIHNPEVNGRIERSGSASCPDHKLAVERYAAVEEADVVILPAFGVPVASSSTCASKGCVLVDTTCGSVLNVWKNVHTLRARRLHLGDPRQALPRGDEGDRLAGPHPSRRPLPVRARPRGGRARLRLHPRERPTRARSSSASPRPTSPGFDPERDLAAASASPTRPRCS